MDINLEYKKIILDSILKSGESLDKSYFRVLDILNLKPEYKSSVLNFLDQPGKIYRAVSDSIDFWKAKTPLGEATVENFIKILKEAEFIRAADLISEELNNNNKAESTSASSLNSEENMEICEHEAIFYTITQIRAYFKPIIKWEFLNDFYRHLDSHLEKRFYQKYKNQIILKVKEDARYILNENMQAEIRKAIEDEEVFIKKMFRASNSALDEPIESIQCDDDIDHFVRFKKIAEESVKSIPLIFLVYAIDKRRNAIRNSKIYVVQKE